MIPEGLSALEARVASDLERISWPNVWWVKRRAGPDGRPLRNVIVIGAGQGGLSIAFQLKRERVNDVLVIDRAPPEGRGPWTTYARMKTLRSPKETTGPDLDIPSLTFRSWFEARSGAAAWQALGKIPKEMWAAYLQWLARMWGVEVEAPAEAISIRPFADHVEVELETPAGRRVERARHVVIATGIETPGRWAAPDFIETLPPTLTAHAADAIDFSRLRGKAVAVLGAGASAFDNAATALEAGAAEVHVFIRRAEIQRLQPYKQISYVGFLRHMGDLDDATRWRFLRHLLTLREAFPVETWRRVTDQPNATIHAGRGWTGAAPTADGRLRLETTRGPFLCDFAIAGTGFDIDLSARPELSPFADRARLWRDAYAPPPGEDEPRLGRYPYLGDTLEFTAKDPADVAALSRLRLFTFGATMSFGPSGSSINALKFSAPRLVSGITRALFREDAEAHLGDLLAYDRPEF